MEQREQVIYFSNCTFCHQSQDQMTQGWVSLSSNTVSKDNHIHMLN
jgi:hypothetical protein